MSNLTLGNTCVLFVYGYLSSPEDEWDISTKSNECVLHRQIEHEFFVVITYWRHCTFEVDLMDCMFTLGSILYNKVVPAIWSPFKDHIWGDHIETSHSI